MKNIDIRDYAKEQNVHLWQIAEGLGIPDSALSRKMRFELSSAEKSRIRQIIEEKAGEPK